MLTDTFVWLLTWQMFTIILWDNFFSMFAIFAMKIDDKFSIVIVEILQILLAYWFVSEFLGSL